MISTWWLLLIAPAGYAGFVYSNWLWIRNGYKPTTTRPNPYRTPQQGERG
jgi:hypothetical protein